MGIFERYLSVWVAMAIAVGVALGLVIPGVFEVVSRLEWTNVNLVVAVLIWVMIYPMMLKVEPSCLKDVGRKPKGLALTPPWRSEKPWRKPAASSNFERKTSTRLVYHTCAR